MKNDKTKLAIEELTLVLMYLTRFIDDPRHFPDSNYAWKGYDFDVLGKLLDKDYIRDGKHPSKSKKVYLTDEGMKYARELLEKYQIQDWKK